MSASARLKRRAAPGAMRTEGAASHIPENFDELTGLRSAPTFNNVKSSPSKTTTEQPKDAKLQQSVADVKEEVPAPAVSEANQVPDLDSRGMPKADDADKRKRLARMPAELSKRVIGQTSPIEMLSFHMQMHYVGLSDPRGPIGVFLFVGPSGVGKTELAKALAAELFSNENLIFRIDMTAFKAKGDVSTLIGSPKGYEDSKDGGVLTNFLEAHQKGAVVLLDEVEKAHAEVIDLFLPAFDEGYLTDGRGIRHDCTNVVFIMTSNLGSPALLEEMLSGAPGEGGGAGGGDGGAQGLTTDDTKAMATFLSSLGLSADHIKAQAEQVGFETTADLVAALSSDELDLDDVVQAMGLNIKQAAAFRRETKGLPEWRRAHASSKWGTGKETRGDDREDSARNIVREYNRSAAGGGSKGGAGSEAESEEDAGQHASGLKNLSADDVESIVYPVVQQNLRPELLGRVDGIAFFKPLTPSEVRTITDINLGQLAKRMSVVSNQNVELVYSPSLADLVQTAAYRPEHGARGVKREVQRLIAAPLATLLLHYRLELLNKGSKIFLNAVEDQLAVTVHPAGSNMGAASAKL